MDALFYHLERARLDEVLPDLLQRCLERGWRSVVQTSLEERVKSVSEILWSWREDSFLAHGVEGDSCPDLHPIWVTSFFSNPNGARVRFLIDGCEYVPVGEIERLVVLFDEGDLSGVVRARGLYKLLKDQGDKVTYWCQDQKGQWVKRSEG